MKTQLELAEEIARNAHAGQFRRDGITPYITHLERVVARLKNESEEVRAVAWLHDVSEDTKVGAVDLGIAGISDEILWAVATLTKTKTENYEKYLENIKENDTARKVKIADMLDNLSDSPTDKQIIKYAKGLLYLLNA